MGDIKKRKRLMRSVQIKLKKIKKCWLDIWLLTPDSLLLIIILSIKKSEGLSSKFYYEIMLSTEKLFTNFIVINFYKHCLKIWDEMLSNF